MYLVNACLSFIQINNVKTSHAFVHAYINTKQSDYILYRDLFTHDQPLPYLFEIFHCKVD